MLTALELQTLDLEGTEMLVPFSQCRMAVMASRLPAKVFTACAAPRTPLSPGVLKTSVAPLWKVDAALQQKLIDRFYRELSAGKGRAEALREAQLQLLKSAGDSGFLEWAPMILSGDSTPLPRQLFAR